MERLFCSKSGRCHACVACLAVLAAVQACSSSNDDLFHKGGASGITGTGGATSGSAGSGAATGGGNQPSGGQSESAGEPGSAGLPEPSGGATSSGGSNSGHAGSSGGNATGSSGSSAGGTEAGGAQSRGGTSGAPATGGRASSTDSGGVPTAGAGGSGGEGVEVCDALDNDANGVIDDLDEKGDGVCDCLRIATLGFQGTWGTGYFISNWLKPLAPHARIDALEGEVLTPETLAGYDIVVALDASQAAINRSYTADEARALAAWVQDGGGLMTLIGFRDPPELANVNLLLAAFDLHYESSAIFIRSGTTPIPVVTEFAVHPITAGVTAVGMDNGYEPRGTGTVYAKKNQVNIGIAQEFSKGHVDVWADEWITYANQWKDRAEYNMPRFWLNTIQWLTPSGVCKVPMPSTLP